MKKSLKDASLASLGLVIKKALWEEVLFQDQKFIPLSADGKAGFSFRSLF